MNALILAAGRGTRLYPLTLRRPKALIEVGGISLLERAILKLSNEGFQRIIINVHHFGDQIIAYLQAHAWPNVEIIISDEREELLDTGGAIKHAGKFLEGAPFLVYNVDVVTDLKLMDLCRFHNNNNPLATLAISQRPTARQLYFDERMLLKGRAIMKPADEALTHAVDVFRTFAFSGIHVVSEKIFDLMPSQDVFSIMDFYLELCKSYPIMGYDHTGIFWMDLGTIENLQLFENLSA
ncbi:MAG TPA: nucleotidyltransferase family protein [Bacteroidales bacterium]|nr:nucleotidyltransferase family protein [Bacteroidales bacterium]MDI9573978.1 nucleotidyltransferase family protein [Bacteroidota bacterium]MBP9588219.1 nucleotidyltransferase family protein [Bacteroidales bacterium]HOE59213.1 nucleotidyltransferase family protein [Bacteroidales bacterium]HOR04999.1 nucleotidyltransferase family protein [Bacteroidales bacterium]